MGVFVGEGGLLVFRMSGKGLGKRRYGSEDMGLDSFAFWGGGRVRKGGRRRSW